MLVTPRALDSCPKSSRELVPRQQQDFRVHQAGRAPAHTQPDGGSSEARGNPDISQVLSVQWKVKVLKKIIVAFIKMYIMHNVFP